MFVLSAFISLGAFSQNRTDISLMWDDEKKQVAEIESESGNLFQDLAHHGPAVENENLALRLYFDRKVAIDVYNKTRAGLELEDAAWYPTEKQQEQGWGADYYKAGETVGLGGVRLWDDEKNKEVFLNPVSRRLGRVCKSANQSYMEMLSEDIPYMGDTIDILVRVTVFSGIREARVEAFALTDKKVKFLTGINHHSTTETKRDEGIICTWGKHPEDVASTQVEIGGAIMYDPEDFESVTKKQTQFELVSKPAKYLKTRITSACEKENGFGSMDDFFEYVKEL